jgi:hypothetical protein
MAYFHQGSANTLTGYGLAFLLGQLPLLLYLADSTQPQSRRLAQFSTFIAFMVMVVTFSVGADWGCYIYLIVLHYFALVVLTREPVNAPITPSRPVFVAMPFFVAMYVLTWGLRHFVSGGASPFVSGEIFRLFGVK